MGESDRSTAACATKKSDASLEKLGLFKKVRGDPIYRVQIAKTA